MSTVLHFPDVYSGDAGIDFSSSYAVISKATQGVNYVNPDYKGFQANARKWNTFFMGYHFLEHHNIQAQANAAFKVVGNLVPLAVDVEPNLASRPTLLDAEQFIDEYKSLGGKIYLTYLPHWYWEAMGSPALDGLKQRSQHLWTSDYPRAGYSDDGPGWQGYGGMDVAVWQYSSTVNYGGIQEVDFNAFRGTGSQSSFKGVLREFENLVSTGSYSGN